MFKTQLNGSSLLAWNPWVACLQGELGSTPVVSTLDVGRVAGEGEIDAGNQYAHIV